MACGVSKKEQKNTLNDVQFHNEITRREERIEIIKMMEELEELKKSREKRCKILTVTEKDLFLGNVEESVRHLNRMSPERAVAIMSEMDALDVIIVLHKTEEIAMAEGTMSIVPYWLSLMENQISLLEEKIISELAYKKQENLISNDEHEKANNILKKYGMNKFFGTELCNKIFIDNTIVKIYNNEYYDNYH
jgi:hypothetical protein